MSSRSWLLVAVMLVCACVAIGCSVYVLSGGTGAKFVIAGLGLSMGLSILCFALLCSFQVGDMKSMRHGVRSEIASFDRKLRDDRGRSETISYEMAELREISNRNAQAISQGFAELREGYSVLNEQLRTTVATVSNFQSARSFAANRNFQSKPFATSGFGAAAKASATVPPFASASVDEVYQAYPEALDDEPEIQPSAAMAHVEDTVYAAPQARATDNLDKLVVSLEPVIDLFTSKTAHYRLHLGMAKPEGGEITQDVLLHHADRTGLRADFDVFAAREALELLRRLRQRDEALNIFMVIGPSTLQSDVALGRILNDMHDHEDVASGLVFELPHAMLAGLSDAGLEGLAKLARAGVLLSLSNVAITGIDLAPLTTLNVRYLSLSAVSVGGAEGPSPALVTFAQGARVARIQTIITGVVDRRVV